MRWHTCSFTHVHFHISCQTLSLTVFFRNGVHLKRSTRSCLFLQDAWKIPAEPINEAPVLFFLEVELIISIMPWICLAASSETLRKIKDRWKNGAVHICKTSSSLIPSKSSSSICKKKKTLKVAVEFLINHLQMWNWPCLKTNTILPPSSSTPPRCSLQQCCLICRKVLKNNYALHQVI